MLLASLGEPYELHVKRCLKHFDKLKHLVLPAFCRMLEFDESDIERTIEIMIANHDVGKLTEKWQRSIRAGKRPPYHAIVSAAYSKMINDSLSTPKELHSYAEFAILIHHIDTGEARASLLRPNQLFYESFESGFGWATGADGVIKRTNSKLGIEAIPPLPNFREMDNVLKQLMRELESFYTRVALFKRHKRRLAALAFHHVLKVCDWRSSHQRRGGKDIRSPAVEAILRGGLLV